MAPILLGGMAAWFLVALIQVGKQVATSRALVRAAETHTPRTWVPHPNQLRLGTERPGSIYRSLFLVQGSVLGLFVVIGLPVLAFDYFEGGWLVIAVPMAWLGILGLGYGALREFVVPAQDERKNRILTHWSSRYRDEADEAAREAQGEIRDGAVPQQGGDRTSLQKVAGTLVAVSGPMAGIGTLLLYGALLISHPNAQRWPGGRAGERADLSDELEMLVDQLVLWTAILVMAAVLTGLIGTVLQVVANNREKRTMWNAVKDPTAERPAEPILRRHSSIQPASSRRSSRRWPAGSSASASPAPCWRPGMSRASPASTAMPTRSSARWSASPAPSSTLVSCSSPAPWWSTTSPRWRS